MKKFAILVSALVIVLVGSICMAGSDVPNLVGTWILKSEAGVLTKSGNEPRKGTHPVGRFTSVAGEIVVKEQKGRVLHGTFTTPRLTENFVAVISPDNKGFYYADHDGLLDGRFVDKDTIEYVYRHVSDVDSVAASGFMTRKK